MGLIAIGDIHGCARTLADLLDHLALTNADHLVFLGDYIDRGPDSRGVIDLLIEVEQHHTCTFLRGNHEALMLNYLGRDEADLWYMNGGTTTMNSYRTVEHAIDIPETHLHFIHETKLYLETPDFFFVHAGIKPQFSVAQNVTYFGEDVFLWERGHLRARSLAWEKCVVCGHTPRPEPTNTDLLINIDTGCVYHTHPQMGHLTAVRLPEREFVSVPYAEEF